MRPRTLASRPEPLALDLDAAALIVNDLQNGFASPGGYLERAGFSIAGADKVVARVVAAVTAARAARMPVFLFRNGIDPKRQAVAAGSPWWFKSPALRLMRRQPELDGTVLIEGTWDHALVDALAPEPDDIVLGKTRPSCFAGTSLDLMLRARGIRTVIVCGIASNVGVEWTLRDALSLEYFGVMLEDAAMAAGPPALHDATVFNVEHFAGWVASTDAFCAIAAEGRDTGA